MAENFTNEGIDLIMGVFPKNGSNFANTYLMLFTGATASTVPAVTSVLATSTGVTEAAGTSYARLAVASTDWGAQAAGTPDGRQSTTSAAKQMATVGAGGWGTVNGFGLANQLATGAGSIGIFYSNFSDTTAIATASGDIIKITPTIGFGA